MLGSLLGGVGSILGGLLGGSESSSGKKKSVTRSRSTTKHTVRLGQLVKQAERAGFNPLTVLNAGGLAAFTKTHTVGLSKTKEKFSGTSQSSSPGAAVAGALNAVGGMMQPEGNALSENAAGAWQAPTGQPAGADELALVNAQLSSAEPILRPPVSSTFKAQPQLGGGSDGTPMQPTFEAPTVTNPFPKDSGIKVDPTVPDAEMWQTRYGELGEYLGGVYVGANDIQKNLGASWEHFIKNDIPAVRNKASSYADKAANAYATNASNLWDPPSISMFLPPVVENKPVPALKYGGAQYGGW